MKKVVSILVFAVTLLTSQFTSAKTVSLFDEDLPKAAKVVNEIARAALKDIVIDKESMVYVTFTVSTDNEIAVLNVRTKDNELKQLIKQALNQKVVEQADLVAGKPYTISIKLKQ